MRWVGVSLKMQILPPVPSLVMTVLAMVWPGDQLRFEAFGGVVPQGHTVRYPELVPPVTVDVEDHRGGVGGYTASPRDDDFGGRAGGADPDPAVLAIDRRLRSRPRLQQARRGPVGHRTTPAG